MHQLTAKPYESQAEAMVELQLRSRGVRARHVLDAMQHIPRHVFVPDLPPIEAYADKALPTLAGQTISQPYIVALMSELLDVKPGDRVLEVGTGSGYQTAVLAYLGAVVTTVEANAELSVQAAERLRQLALAEHVNFVAGDGTLGHAANAPYDAILVTAAAPRVPEAFEQQLADGGRIVIPLGDRAEQQLTLLRRIGKRWKRSQHCTCRFVPLIGKDAFEL